MDNNLVNLLNPKYEYPNLKRVTTKEGRKYVGEDDNPVPSVTTVLSDTGDKTALIAWRKRVGDEEANRISRESAGLGTKVHNAIEKYILGEEYEIKGNNFISEMARPMVNNMIEQGVGKIDEIWGVEVGLIAEGLYAGTSDCIGVYEGKDTIIDFKTAKQIKKREWIEDYFMQGCAYAIAHNEMFGTNINKVAIFMIDRTAKFAEFVIEGDEFEEYKSKWLLRLEDYYKLQK